MVVQARPERVERSPVRVRAGLPAATQVLQNGQPKTRPAGARRGETTMSDSTLASMAARFWRRAALGP